MGKVVSGGKHTDSWLQKSGLMGIVHITTAYLFARLLWLVTTGAFIIDPIKQTTTLTGKLAITYLGLSLACTPVAIVFGWNQILRVRKPLGLYAFGFAFLHGLTYLVWDYQFDLPLIFESIIYQRYVLVGGSAFFILLLLAMTSIKTIRVKMGENWKKLQRLVYVSGVLAVIHVMWLRKTPLEVLPLIIIFSILYVVRVPLVRKGIINLRKSITKDENIR